MSLKAMNPVSNVGYAVGEPHSAAAKPLPMYAPASSAVWTSQPGMMNEPNLYTQPARYSLPTQETYSNMMMSANMMGAAMSPQMLAMMNAGCPPVNNMVMNLDVPPSSFNKAVNFSKVNEGAAAAQHDVNHNGYTGGAYGSIPDQRHLDAENSLAEQSQTREQAQLLEQFKQLRQWQQQQQQMLLHQQQAQLMKLQEEQHMIQNMISKQRQAQWGDGLTQPGYPQNESAMEGFGSPKKTMKQMSTVPQALAHDAMAMAHMDPMLAQMQSLHRPGQGGYLVHPGTNLQDPDNQDHDDADSTVIESASLYGDNEGIEPLPGSEAWHAQQKLIADRELKNTQRNASQVRDSDEYESEDDVESYAGEMDMEGEDLDYREAQNDDRGNGGNYDQDRDVSDSDDDGRPFTKATMVKPKSESEIRQFEDEVNSDEEDRDKEDEEADEDQEVQMPDEKPIVSCQKPFEALLEEELQKEQEMLKSEETKKSTSGKRRLPFLKKGQGLARFGLFKSLRRSIRNSGKGSPKSKPVASTPVRPTKAQEDSQSKKADDSKNQKGSGSNSKNFGKGSALSRLLMTKTWSDTPKSIKQSGSVTASQALPSEPLSQLPPTASGSKVSSVLSNEKSTSSAVKKAVPVLSRSGNSSFQRKKMEQEELEEFEILEQFADDNASFLSNMSAVNRAVVSKKHERSAKPSAPANDIQPGISVETRVPEKHADTDEDDDEDIRSEELSNSEDDEFEENEVKNGEERDQDDSEGDETIGKVINSDIDDDDCELKTSQNSKTNIDLPRKLASLSNPSKTATQTHDPKLNSAAHLSKVMHWSQSESEGQDMESGRHKVNSGDPSFNNESQGFSNRAKQTAVDFGDDEEWGDPGTPVKYVSGTAAVRSAITKTKVSPVNISNKPGYNSPPPTSQLVNKLFPSLKQEQAKLQQKKQEEMAEKLEATKQAGAASDGVQSKLLRDKLMQLENEIEKFKTENATLIRLRKEREEGLQELKKEMTEFEKQKDEELKRLQEFKAEETKKLKKEKKQFEDYKKAMKTLPDKKEREEIESLKKQLADVQEEMKRKESRWTSSNTRMRNRIEELETENQELKEEVRLMEKRRLEQWQQGSANRSNIVHSKPSNKLPQTSPMPESKPAQYSTQDNALRLSNNMDHDSQDETMSDISDSSQLTTPSEAAAVRAAMPPVPSSFPAASGAAHGFQPTAMRTAAPQPFAKPDLQLSPGVRRSSEGKLPAMASAAAAASPSVLSADGDSSRRGGSRKRAMPVNISNTIDKGNEEYEEVTHPDGKVEKMYSNGAREILFANGTRKQVSSDGQSIIVSFFNGDIKQIMADQRVVYFYAEGQTTHTTYPDSLEILQFPNGQTEKHYPDGTKEITFPDQTMKYLFPNGSEESIFPDGMVIRQEQNGQKVMEFPNGQREVHTSQYKRREYPDGTVKTVYPDGRQETRYSSGRLRVKDKNGSIIVDKRI